MNDERFVHSSKWHDALQRKGRVAAVEALSRAIDDDVLGEIGIQNLEADNLGRTAVREYFALIDAEGSRE